MTPERTNQLHETRQRYLTLPPNEQQAFLQQLRSSQPDLAAALEADLAQSPHPDTVDYVSQADSADDQRTTDYHPANQDSDIPTQIGRYAIDSKLGEGGMGVVYRGRDPDLERFLAVKVIKEGRQDDADLCRRFLEEAQVMGQLQHPGVAPIHEIGTLDDGRPFFSMKQVEGHTLADLLKKREAPSHDLPRFLGIFEQICQTLAFAHSQGIIHRDLKPTNIMVGAFGEVQVMDWGLAKQIDRHAPESAIQESKPEASAKDQPLEGTQTGVAMGTPAYMAPEQARGDIAELDQRADVFGLGAILCEILTGRPPFWSTNHDEVFEFARRGAVGEALARLESCGADSELIALCQTCLEPHKEERPRDAGEVGEAVTAHLESVQQRLQQAEIERAQAQTKALEERKRRRVWLGLAAAVLALLLFGSGTVIWVQNKLEQDRIEEAQREHERQQQQSKEANRLTRVRDDQNRSIAKIRDLINRYRLVEAGSELQQAEKRLGHNGLSDLKARLETWKKAWRRVTLLDQVRQRKAMVVGGGINDHRTADKDYELAFAKLELGSPEVDDPILVAQRLRVSVVREHLIAAVDDWATTTKKTKRRDWLLAVARAADPSDYANQFRDPKLWDDGEKLKRFAAKLDVTRLSPPLLDTLSAGLKFGSADQIKLMRRAREHYPRDFWLNFDLAGVLWKTQLDEAMGYWRVALLLRPKNAAAHNNLGLAFRAKEEPDLAITHYKKAIVLQSDFAAPYNNLGAIYADIGDLGKAIAYYKQALSIDPDIAQTHYNMGIAYTVKGDQDKAIACYQNVIAIAPKHAKAHYNLGVAYGDIGEKEKAIACYKTALGINPQIAEAHTNLGIAYAGKGRLDMAIKHYNIALGISPNLAQANYYLGLAYVQKRELEKAIACFKKTITVDPECIPAHNSLGITYYDKGELDKAFACYNKALSINPKFAPALYNLGLIYAAKDQREKAIIYFQKSIAIDPNDANVYYSLGKSYAAKNKLNEAIAFYKKSLGIDPNVAHAHGAMGRALLRLGNFVEARQATLRCLQLLANNNPLRGVAERQLYDCDRLLALAKKLQQFDHKIYKPNDVQEMLALAQFCQQSHEQRYLQAVKWYHQSFQADSKVAQDIAGQYRYNAACAATLASTGQGKDTHDLKEQERTTLRKQAFKWLQAELTAYGKLTEKNDTQLNRIISKRLTHWQKDSDLQSIRDLKYLKKLPQDEQNQWRKLWTDIHAVLVRTQSNKNTKTTKLPETAVTNKSVLEGTLTATDPLDTFPMTKKSRHKVHILELKANATYQIDLCGDFDTFLRIENLKKKVVAFNDDVSPPKNLDSRLIYQPKETGKHRLIVTSFLPATGKYTLTVRQVQPAGKAIVLTDKLTKNDKKVQNKYAKFHKIQLTASKPYTIDVESKTFDTFLVLIDATGKRGLAQNNDARPGDTARARIDFTPATSGTYHVLVTSFRPGEVGDYRVRVQAYQPRNGTNPK